MIVCPFCQLSPGPTPARNHYECECGRLACVEYNSPQRGALQSFVLFQSSVPTVGRWNYAIRMMRVLEDGSFNHNMYGDSAWTNDVGDEGRDGVVDDIMTRFALSCVLDS